MSRRITVIAIRRIANSFWRCDAHFLDANQHATWTLNAGPDGQVPAYTMADWLHQIAGDIERLGNTQPAPPPWMVSDSDHPLRHVALELAEQ